MSAFKFPPAAEYTCGGLSSTSSNRRTKRTLLNALASSGSFPAEQNAIPPSFPPSFTCRGEHRSRALTVHSSNMIIYTRISEATHDSLQTASAHGSNCDSCTHWEFEERQSITHKRVIADKCVDAKQRGMGTMLFSLLILLVIYFNLNLHKATIAEEIWIAETESPVWSRLQN